MTTYDNTATVDVSEQYTGDLPIVISIRQVEDEVCGNHWSERRARFAYTVTHDGVVVITGSDIYGAAFGQTPEAGDMAYTLASFLSAASEQSELQDGYTDGELAWLDEHGERLGNFASERDERDCELDG